MRSVGASTTTHFHLGVDMGTALYFAGSIISLVGVVWLIVLAFQDSILWGLLSLFIPCAILVFIAKAWPVTMRPTMIMLGGWVLSGIGFAMGGGPQMPQM